MDNALANSRVKLILCHYLMSAIESQDNQDLSDALNAMRVARTIHGVYDQEAKKANPKFENWYHEHFADGLTYFFGCTPPGILLAIGNRNDTIQTIITPLGGLSITGSGSGCGFTLPRGDFEMVQLTADEKYNCRWYQITRVGDKKYAPITWSEHICTFKRDLGDHNERRNRTHILAKKAFRDGIIGDKLGLTAKLLAGEHVDLQDLIKNNRNEYFTPERYESYRLYDGDVINWGVWWKMVYSTHLNL